MNNTVKRNAIDVAIDMLSAFPSVTLNGARQVGKSTFAEQILSKMNGSIVSLDDENTFEAAEKNPIDFLRQNKEGLLVIDEIQRLPKLTLAIKREIDKHKRAGKFLLTGSSDILKMRQNPESLAGRTVDLDMYGFSQGELLGVKEDFVSKISDGLNFINYKSKYSKTDYSKMIYAGQYPEQSNRENARQKLYWYSGYIKHMLTKDLQDISGHLIPERLDEILRIIAANQAGSLVKGRIADKLSLSRSIITNYVDALETMNIIKTIPIYSRNLTKKVISYKKSIVLDTGLCMYLNGLNDKNISAIENMSIFGSQFEGFIIGELFRQKSWSALDYDIYYFRNTRGEEVDIVIELLDGSIILFEVKSSSTHKYESFRNIRKLADELGSRFRAGFVVTTSEDVQIGGKNMWSIPASLLWEIGL
jgi:predicted AAA+ superfamily ATPase